MIEVIMGWSHKLKIWKREEKIKGKKQKQDKIFKKNNKKKNGKGTKYK